MTTDNTVMNQQIRQSLADRREPRQQAIRDRHAARVEEGWRRRYLAADPQATAEDFAEALPSIREALRRRAVTDGKAP